MSGVERRASRANRPSKVGRRASSAARWQAGDGAQGNARPAIALRPSTLVPRPAWRAFTLVEILVVVALMALIVTSLMTVFSATQNAFRASLTQTDVLENGRIVMGLIKNDMDSMTPSLDVSNGTVNFSVTNNFYQYQSGRNPLVQPLVGSSYQRTNVLENFFILTRQGTTWTGTGYVVDTTATNSFNPLYRFSTNVVAAVGPATLFKTFSNLVATATFTNMSHLMDGVVSLTVRPGDPNGYWMTNVFDFYNGRTVTNHNIRFLPPPPPALAGTVCFYMYSNTLPASVQVELGVLEDRPLQRAASVFDLPPVLIRSNYLAQQAGKVHLFRQNFVIRNVDPSAYQ